MENKYLKMVCKEDRDNITNESIGIMISCLSNECDLKFFLITKEYKIKYITCPWCEQKHKVRCYKNGSVSVSVAK